MRTDAPTPATPAEVETDDGEDILISLCFLIMVLLKNYRTIAPRPPLYHPGTLAAVGMGIGLTLGAVALIAALVMWFKMRSPVKLRTSPDRTSSHCSNTMVPFFMPFSPTFLHVFSTYQGEDIAKCCGWVGDKASTAAAKVQ